MSKVSGIVLVCSVGEEGMDERSDNLEEPWKLRKINDWLASQPLKFLPLADMSEQTAGGEHPQFHLFGAGYNYFPEDEFAAFLMALEWYIPENVVLVIEPEEGATRVWRPESQQ